MVETRAKIQQAFDDAAFVQEVLRRDVPMLCTDWGAKDEDALVHSLGIILLSSVGRELDFFAISEFPVPRAERWQRKLVRVDSAWFDRKTRQVILLAEFERFSRDTALEKLANLCVASHGCDGVPDVLLLCLWSLDGAAVDAPWLSADQLSVAGGPPVSAAKNSTVVIMHAVFGRRGDRLHFLRLRRIS